MLNLSAEASSKIEERNLLYLKPAAISDTLSGGFAAAGWDIRVVSDITVAQELCKQYDFPVGLTHLDYYKDDPLFLRAWEDLYLSNSDSLWVALLSPDINPDNKIFSLIKHLFYDFHTLPVDVPRLLVTLGHAMGMAQLQSAAKSLSSERKDASGIVGSSPAMQQFRRKLAKVTMVDTPVLITGESGTGKEISAYSIHMRSERCHAPFVAVNCGSIPPNLIQSELFGYEKGAFTGAYQRHIGRIETAMGGTIFLDEIGDLPLELQGNLLRFLQEKRIVRVGSNQEIPVDVRIITATNVPLEKAVAQGYFREDLYYRLNVIQLDVPPLRERGNDIEELAQYFFHKFSMEKNPRIRGLSRSAIEAMKEYSWPGNVRELINRMRNALVMSENRMITPRDLRFEHINPKQNLEILSLAKARAQAEKKAINHALHHASLNLSQAAKTLGISRATLYRLMTKYRIETREVQEINGNAQMV